MLCVWHSGESSCTFWTEINDIYRPLFVQPTVFAASRQRFHAMMDGTKYVVPGSCKENKIEIISWFGSEEQIALCPGCKSGNIRAHNGIYSIIKDWRSNQTMTFLSMVRGGKASGSV